MNVPEQFETRRLTIRRVRPLDARQVFDRWAQDLDVTRYLSWTPHRRIENTAAFLAFCWSEWEEQREFVWVLAEHGSDALLGSIATRAGDHGISVGYLLTRDAWGCGLMAEALGEVSEWWLSQDSVFRIWATCHPENRASARVLEKSGFEYEGRLRCWEEYPNLGSQPADSLCFSRVASPSSSSSRALRVDVENADSSSSLSGPSGVHALAEPGAAGDVRPGIVPE